MASLKEVRNRITSVTSTRKITSAMKLVSAAKLRRAQDAVANYLPYQEKLTQILTDFLNNSTDEIELPLNQQRSEIKRMAIVCISSNSSLCGAFNNNVIKRTETILEKYADLAKSDILIFPIGKKITEALQRKGYTVQGDFSHLTEKPDYTEVAEIANTLIKLFLNKEIDTVRLVYNHFKNTAVQQVRGEVYLPMAKHICAPGEKPQVVDYILEPDKDYLIKQLAPTVMRLKLYSALLDSIAAEHGARTTAMQTATDNAGELIKELKLQYNKARQEAITNEILDIVGGAEGLK
jgi:F-type H+-transporting ATPase subunit gamma